MVLKIWLTMFTSFSMSYYLCQYELLHSIQPIIVAASIIVSALVWLSDDHPFLARILLGISSAIQVLSFLTFWLIEKASLTMSVPSYINELFLFLLSLCIIMIFVLRSDGVLFMTAGLCTGSGMAWAIVTFFQMLMHQPSIALIFPLLAPSFALLFARNRTFWIAPFIVPVFFLTISTSLSLHRYGDGINHRTLSTPDLSLLLGWVFTMGIGLMLAPFLNRKPGEFKAMKSFDEVEKQYESRTVNHG
ncbi:hypothetical protein [Priestia koreensis]|uniref:hypothetical protein n=1 Tax=Priestia koreensis TaxID=284581 RepID=UPI0028F70C4E|nr:hypothetical protein [Priestia koreensis]